MPDYSYYLLDVFSDKIFGGNQLAIFPDASEIDEALFQKIALEFNLAETVFLFPPKNGSEIHSMRVFTPQSELPTAGHPTIGTAFFLAAQQNDKNVIEIDQKIGRIKVDLTFLDNGEPNLITMYQPLPLFGKIHESRAQISEIIGLKEKDLLNLPIQEVSCGNNFLFIPLESSNKLKDVKINPSLLDELETESMGVYVFSINDVADGDVKGRMFAPELGIVEDPATGSANGPLACYLSKYNISTFPITSLQGFEMNRPSFLYLDIIKDENEEINEVKVSGKCKFVGMGELFLNLE